MALAGHYAVSVCGITIIPPACAYQGALKSENMDRVAPNVDQSSESTTHLEWRRWCTRREWAEV